MANKIIPTTEIVHPGRGRLIVNTSELDMWLAKGCYVLGEEPEEQADEPDEDEDEDEDEE